MKSFFVALLALPAALAAPAAAASHEVDACACVNAQGETFVPGVCLYLGGRNLKVDGQDYCFPADSTFESEVAKTFTADLCAQEYPNYPLSKCVKANSCPLLGTVNQPC